MEEQIAALTKLMMEIRQENKDLKKELVDLRVILNFWFFFWQQQKKENQSPSTYNHSPSMESNSTQPQLPSIHNLCKESLNLFRKDHIFIKTSGISQKVFVNKLKEDFADVIHRLFFSFRNNEIHIYCNNIETLVNIYNHYLFKKIAIGDKKLSFVFYREKNETPFRIRLSGLEVSQIPNWELQLKTKLRREVKHGVQTLSHIAEVKTLPPDLKKILNDNRLRNVIQAVNFCPKCLDFYSSEPRLHVCKSTPTTSQSHSTSPQAHSTSSQPHSTSSQSHSTTSQSHSPRSSLPQLISKQRINWTGNKPAQTHQSTSSPSSPTTSSVAQIAKETSSQPSTHNTLRVGHNVDTVQPSIFHNLVTSNDSSNSTLPPSPSQVPPESIKLIIRGLSQNTIQTFLSSKEPHPTSAILDTTSRQTST